MAPIGADRFFVGGAREKAAGTCNKYDNTQLAEEVLEIEVATLNSPGFGGRPAVIVAATDDAAYCRAHIAVAPAPPPWQVAAPPCSRRTPPQSEFSVSVIMCVCPLCHAVGKK